MAANSRSKATTWAQGDQVKATQFETVESNAAKAVARTSTTSGWRAMPFCATPNANFSVDDSGVISITDVSVPNRMLLALSGLPNGHTLTGVRLWIIPSTGHGGQPANLPVLRLYEKESTLVSATPTELGTATAAFAGTAAYEAGEGLTISITGATIDHNTKAYYCVFVNEHGGNAVAGIKFGGLDARVTVDTASGGQDFTHWRTV